MKFKRKKFVALVLMGATVFMLLAGCPNPVDMPQEQIINPQSKAAPPAFNLNPPNSWSEKNGTAEGAGVSISGSGQSYTATWSNISQGWCYGKGWKTGIPDTIYYQLDYTPSQGGCVGVYGWLESNASSYSYTEFYIVDGFGTVEGPHNNDNDGIYSPNSDPGGFPEKVGSPYMMDGVQYQMYKHVRKGKPSPKGDTDFMQWIAVPVAGGIRKAGTVSIKAHVDKMAQLMGTTVKTRTDSSSSPKYWTVYTIEGWISPAQNTPDPKNGNVPMNPDGKGATINTGYAKVTLVNSAPKGFVGVGNDLFNFGEETVWTSAAAATGGKVYFGGEFRPYVADNSLNQYPGLPYYVNSLVLDSYGTLYANTGMNVMKCSSSGSWSQIGDTFGPGIHFIAMDSNKVLWAVGSFPGYVKKYNSGKNLWEVLPVANPFDYAVERIVAGPDGNMYVGGRFTGCVALWNAAGQAWDMIGEDLFDDTTDNIFAMVYKNNALYVGGGFSNYIYGKMFHNIAMYNGSTWGAFKGGTNSFVSAIVLDSSNNVYVGGGFTIAGYNQANVAAKGLAKWNASSTSWSAYDTNLAEGDPRGRGGVPTVTVRTLAFDSQGTLYAGGWFKSFNGYNNVAAFK